MGANRGCPCTILPETPLHGETLAMGYRRALIRLLDRPGARGVLTAIINLQARRCAPGVRVYYQRGMWMHQENGVTYVDSPTMDYHPAIFPTWRTN